jgi:hypothetical protein
VHLSAEHVFLYLLESTFFFGALLDSSVSEEDCRFLFDLVTTLLALFVDGFSRLVAMDIFRVEVEEFFFFAAAAATAAASLFRRWLS